MSIYQTMSTRRSVRTYTKQSLDVNQIKEISDYLDSIKQLDGANCCYKIVNADQVKNNKAPHYILAYSDESLSSLISVGYTLQKMDLYLQDIGLGSLWLGTAKPSDKNDYNGMPYAIMLAFGQTNLPKRTSETQFSRLKLQDISDTDNNIAKIMRLAPSAANTQPWHLNFQKNQITINYVGRGILKVILKPKLSKIDLGIMTCFGEYALIQNGFMLKNITTKEKGSSYLVEIHFVPS